MKPDEDGRRPVDRSRFDRPYRRDVPAAVGREAPERAGQDWDALEAEASGSVPADGADPVDVERDGELPEEGGLPEENDDNPDQESDEALPDDEEERAIGRDMGGLGMRYEPE